MVVLFIVLLFCCFAVLLVIVLFCYFVVCCFLLEAVLLAVVCGSGVAFVYDGRFLDRGGDGSRLVGF